MKTNSLRQLLFFASAVIPLMSITGYTQTAPGGASQPTTQTQPLTQGSLPATSDTANLQAIDDKDFVHKALEGGSVEVQLGQLAAQRAQGEDVKQFGQRMVQDHSQLAAQVIEPLAKQLGIDPPKGLSKKDKEFMANLEGLSGTQFDQAYIKAMLKDHKQDLKEFKDEAGMSQDPSVKRAAEQGEALVSQHLQMIQEIAQKHDVAVNGKGR